MQNFFPGQRWISETEPELGLGIVVEANTRTVQVFFHAAGEMRNYAASNAPLNRVRFAEGDEVKSNDGKTFVIAAVEEEPHGLVAYCADDGFRLPETELSDTSGFDRPETRLLNGHVDENVLFDLRLETLRARHRYSSLPVRGLLGARIDLLPHQLYIAHEVSNRPLPRVLLADEVGLGKTIEACLILHRLMVCNIVQRVLILVPNALVHQWFVELLRRFNLSFSIFDEERCAAIETGDPVTNPFLDEQLVLTNIEFLAGNPQRAAQAAACKWDLMIVDEAHHLHWSPENSSIEYTIVEQFARAIPRLLLLTASPEQMGLESHFARLHLLDPQRYPDVERFMAEHAHYADAAQTIEAELDTLTEQELAEALDRHGAGRVIFRNTRRNMTGFPKRIPHLVQLEDEAAPRPAVNWLVGFIHGHPAEKILVISKTAAEVTALVEAIKKQSGVDIANFHEKMPLVQCDRQAAWFAEPDGAQVMVVSEMGGEGRNFQMASHLVLIDLPDDPELLEQRIGRLDRIGQRGDVHIHVPYLSGSEEAQTVRWLHEGLNAFAEPVIGGYEMFERFKNRLDQVTDAVIAETRSEYSRVRKQIESGRDRLLELSSFRPEIGREVVEEIRSCEQTDDLQQYLLNLFDQYGIRVEALDRHSFHIRPDQLFDEWFPLPPDGLRITFSRSEALVHPDTILMSWDHPMVTGAGEMISSTERGSCAIAVDPAQDVPLKLQAVYILETVAPPGLNADRFLPPTPISISIDHAGTETEETTTRHLKDGESWKLLEHEGVRTQMIPNMLETSKTMAEQQAENIRSEARQQMLKTLGAEFQRLEHLQKVNDNIRDDELRHARKSISRLDRLLADARLRLDAIRIITAV
ncbi:SNF2-related protein [Pontiella agarivorans]|uniref:SNF2-related protein n=1 Tax=Pontiella agarivorans TaxID=3038953 RepID=A0ABU5N0P5_9BACT|nr:SNF2-related protein [Pontiella agarivorans]MDZ8119993.1 SNF2-related protein [Pontiella agarivorans]